MPSSRMPGCSHFNQPGKQRDGLDEETTDWRAACGKTACTVRRAGSARAIPTPITTTPRSTRRTEARRRAVRGARMIWRSEFVERVNGLRPARGCSFLARLRQDLLARLRKDPVAPSDVEPKARLRQDGRGPWTRRVLHANSAYPRDRFCSLMECTLVMGQELPAVGRNSRSAVLRRSCACLGALRLIA